MNRLFEIKELDKKVYEEELRDFLPEKIIDIHTHSWLDEFMGVDEEEEKRAVTWTSLVAKDNSIEDLFETYRLMFPDKEVTPLIFSFPNLQLDLASGNQYCSHATQSHHCHALLVSVPEWSAAEYRSKLLAGNFVGGKVYLNYAPRSIAQNDIGIFDFIPHHQLSVLDELGAILMLHIPRAARLKDSDNIREMLEIADKYPHIRVIIAHIGRAYCNEDLGNALELLQAAKSFYYDFSANTNAYVMSELLKAVGAKRVLFGSDLPILRMRMRRICENGHYVNLVPPGLYGDVSGDKNMREVSPEEGEGMTFFMYEELLAFKQAASQLALTKDDINDVFYGNADRLLQEVATKLGGLRS